MLQHLMFSYYNSLITLWFSGTIIQDRAHVLGPHSQQDTPPLPFFLASTISLDPAGSCQHPKISVPKLNFAFLPSSVLPPCHQSRWAAVKTQLSYSMAPWAQNTISWSAVLWSWLSDPHRFMNTVLSHRAWSDILVTAEVENQTGRWVDL